MADTLKRYTTTGVTNSANTIYTAGSGVTATMLSITLCNIHATIDTLFDLKLMHGGSTEFYLYRDQSLPAQATFVHNGKLTLKATDTLVALMDTASSTIDVYISVLEQTA